MARARIWYGEEEYGHTATLYQTPLHMAIQGKGDCDCDCDFILFFLFTYLQILFFFSLYLFADYELVKLLLSRGADISLSKHFLSANVVGTKITKVTDMIAGDPEMIRYVAECAFGESHIVES